MLFSFHQLKCHDTHFYFKLVCNFFFPIPVLLGNSLIFECLLHLCSEETIALLNTVSSRRWWESGLACVFLFPLYFCRMLTSPLSFIVIPFPPLSLFPESVFLSGCHLHSSPLSSVFPLLPSHSIFIWHLLLHIVFLEVGFPVLLNLFFNPNPLFKKINKKKPPTKAPPYPPVVVRARAQMEFRVDSPPTVKFLGSLSPSNVEVISHV